MTQTILVTSATGQQGTALIDALLSPSSSHSTTPPPKIHALTRDPSSPAAQSLLKSHPTITLFPGSFDDIPSLLTAAKTCTSAFLNVSPVFTDPHGESRHATNLLRICAETPTLKRVVFSSSGAMHTPNLNEVFSKYIPENPNSWMGVYMTSKKACEDAVATSTAAEFEEGWTVIRGAMFYSNFVSPFAPFMYPDLAAKQIITTAAWPEHKISLVSAIDIGKLAARMLLASSEEWNQQWKFRFVPLAKENLTMSEIAGSMNRAIAKRGVSKEIKIDYVPEEEAKKRVDEGDLRLSTQVYGNEYSLPFDLEEVKGFGIDLEGMVGADEFYEREGERVVEAVGGI